MWPLLTAALLLLVWHAGVRWSGTDVLPSPVDVGRAVGELLRGGVLWGYIGDSLWRVTAGYLAAAAIGIPCGLLLGWFPTAAQVVNPVIQILRPISPIAWIPVSIVLFGVGDLAATYLIFLGAFFPIVVSASNGVRNVPAMYRWAGRNFGLSQSGNNGDGTFTDVAREAGLDDFAIASVAYWIDYDHDGWLDLVQYCWSDHEDVVHTMRYGEGPPDGQPIRLYHNNRDGTFTLRSREMGLTGCWGTMSGNAGDINNDGHLDIFLGNGSPRMDRVEPLTMIERGPSGFRDVTFAAGLPFTGKSHGVNLADLGGDGRLCLIVAAGGAYPGDLLTTAVYRPVTRPGHYLNVRLTGTTSNRDAIGARLVLHAGGRQLHRHVSGGSQFGCLPFEQHFGLGDCAVPDALDILWPSGLRQRVAPLPGDSTIRIVEGDDRVLPVYTR